MNDKVLDFKFEKGISCKYCNYASIRFYRYTRFFHVYLQAYYEKVLNNDI